MASVLFDLDGTLADTAPDLWQTLVVLQQEQGLTPLPFEAVRNHVSHGSGAMVRLGFPGIDTTRFDALVARFLEIYAENLHVHSRLFDGMDRLLDDIEASGLSWGVVTNKPGWLTDPLLKSMGLYDRAATVISGDTTAERKPHPLPLLFACEQAGVSPEACVYVGDAERDIAAGRAAGMRTLIAAYGYIDPAQTPNTWGADDFVASPPEIFDKGVRPLLERWGQTPL